MNHEAQNVSKEKKPENQMQPAADEDDYEIRVRYRILTSHICQSCGERIEHFAIGDNFTVSVFESTEECYNCVHAEAMNQLGL